MTKSEALAHFGGNVSALMRSLGMSQNSFYAWKGEAIPPALQIKLERITNYWLIADAEAWSPAPETFSDEHIVNFRRSTRQLRASISKGKKQ